MYQEAEPKPLHFAGEMPCVLSALLGFVQELIKIEDPSLILTQYLQSLSQSLAVLLTDYVECDG